MSPLNSMVESTSYVNTVAILRSAYIIVHINLNISTDGEMRQGKWK